MTKSFQKPLALIIAFMMLLTLNITAFAADGGITTTTVAKPDLIASVSIGSQPAVYQKDSNTADQIYIRSTLSSSKSEYDLQNAVLKITVKDAATTVTSPDLTFSQSGKIYTASAANFLNQAYTVNVGGVNYIVAAGLPGGAVAISDNDPLAVKGATLDGNVATISATNVANPLMGNPAAQGSWTNVAYLITSNVYGLTDVAGTLSLNSGATVSGCAAGSGSNYTFTLTASNPVLAITNNGESRDYRVHASVVGNQVTVSFSFDFSQLDKYIRDNPGFADAAVMRARADLIEQKAAAYFANNQITVSSGTSVMQVLQTFLAQSGMPYSIGYGGTYLQSINNLGEFDVGSMSGWMYTVAGKFPDFGAAQYFITSTMDSPIVWKYVTEYSWN